MVRIGTFLSLELLSNSMERHDYHKLDDNAFENPTIMAIIWNGSQWPQNSRNNSLTHHSVNKSGNEWDLGLISDIPFVTQKY